MGGGTWGVDDKVWFVGGGDEAVVIDAAHDADAVAEAVGGRRVVAVVCARAYNGHVNVAPALAVATGASVLFHLDGRLLWKRTHPGRGPGGYRCDNQRVQVAGRQLRVLHVPGHAPGASCLRLSGLGTVFTGDPLFVGGPGATGRSYSRFPAIIWSIRDRLLVVLPTTAVRTGHGANTDVGDEAPHLAVWVAMRLLSCKARSPGSVPVSVRPAGTSFRGAGGLAGVGVLCGARAVAVGVCCGRVAVAWVWGFYRMCAGVVKSRFFGG
ncbi:hypothetical protein GCM10010377_81430 [Streptomyces viridiviolaceus]|nr:hypothetical protein GCM10010377_81430 [Streptomyces viridiviolaceus]